MDDATPELSHRRDAPLESGRDAETRDRHGPHDRGSARDDGGPLDQAGAPLARIRGDLASVIQGEGDSIVFAMACLLAGGHLLIEDVPGTGKTTLARALAVASGLDFRRIQMTADLLPSDLTGARFPALDASPTGGSAAGGATHFEFVPGPLFSQVVLADELNRTPPRTQSALLECMAEGHLTIDGERHELPRPFFVIATQNPIEFAGTFPLPESQLDRFMMRLSLGYPSRDAERRILRDRRGGDPLAALAPSIDRSELSRAIEAVDGIVVHPKIEDYVLDLVAATRTSPDIELGASPRGALDLERASRALALLDGRSWVSPEDVRRLAVPTLAHRLVAGDGVALVDQGSAETTPRTAEERALEAVLAGVAAPQLGADGQLA